MAPETVRESAGDTVPPPADEVPIAEVDPGPPPPPDVDAASLMRLLDGQYPVVRDLVRRNLTTHAGVLEDAETLSRDEYRDRVRDLLVEMAATGQTGMGFPKEYGGGGDIGASVAAFETLAFGDLSLLVKAGV
jgi:acyl-CoA oxidase